ncbi:MAG TPA: hypothetical protein VG317_19695 [Pseudonocardiaceae bacterium]|nr:hypothetical protein [Pseudonocardiaceae bacterium]
MTGKTRTPTSGRPKSGKSQGGNKQGGTRKGANAVTAARKASGGHQWLWYAGAVVVIVVLVVAIAVAVSNRSGSSSQAQSTGNAQGIPDHPITTAAGLRIPAPWDNASDVTGAVHNAGLPMLPQEALTEHIHVHLDVIVNGQPVTVPQYVGIDNVAQSISPLHTHDTSGVIHIESPRQATFSLAQFFTEWNIALSSGRIGGYADGNGDTLRAYVNGKQVSGSPGAITFNAHDEIALIYGPATASANVPSSYNFPAGE